MYGKEETSPCAENCYSYYNRYAFGLKVVYRTMRRSSFAAYFIEAMTTTSDFGEFLGSPFSLVRFWSYGSFYFFVTLVRICKSTQVVFYDVFLIFARSEFYYLGLVKVCRSQMEELKGTLRLANAKVRECLKNDEELQENQEEMRKALDMQDATLDRLKAELKTVKTRMDEMSQQLDGLEDHLSKMALQMKKLDASTRTKVTTTSEEIEPNELHGVELRAEISEYRQVFLPLGPPRGST